MPALDIYLQKDRRGNKGCNSGGRFGGCSPLTHSIKGCLVLSGAWRPRDGSLSGVWSSAPGEKDDGKGGRPAKISQIIYQSQDNKAPTVRITREFSEEEKKKGDRGGRAGKVTFGETRLDAFGAPFEDVFASLEPDDVEPKRKFPPHGERSETNPRRRGFSCPGSWLIDLDGE
ncbi:hypothetical protein BC826DRAFT_968664 [Russula brevipes]|nr:hypothetical protein BC826DRAFT_968664 [Russula brevipes]